jgi:hypothetical protein
MRCKSGSSVSDLKMRLSNAVATMNKTIVADLPEKIALTAADLSLAHRIQGLADVTVFPKRRR